MHNNYSTTNNYYSSMGVGTTVVRYENPRVGILNGLVYEFYGMLMVTTVKEKENNEFPEVVTHRQPLIGQSYRPGMALGQYDDYWFYLFPEDRVLDEHHLKQAVSRCNEHDTMHELMDSLATYGVKFQSDRQDIVVSLDFKEEYNTLFVTSDAFSFTFDKVDRKKILNMSPADFYQLLELKRYMGVELVFVPLDEGDKEVDDLIARLEKWLVEFEKKGLLHDCNNVHVCNDGEYSYTEDFGRISMTREEFLQKFPDAYEF